MKFKLRQNGDLKFKVFFPMTNKDMKKAILAEIELQRVQLSPEQQKALKSYLNGLTDDGLFVDPCGEMELSFGFKK